MNTPKEKLAANSSLATCSLSLEDRAAEYAEALNDIADMLQLPTGATSADIVAACYRVLNMATKQTERMKAVANALRGTILALEKSQHHHPESGFGQMCDKWKKDADWLSRLARKLSSPNV